MVVDVDCGTEITPAKRFAVNFCAVFVEFEGEGGVVEVPYKVILGW